MVRFRGVTKMYAAGKHFVDVNKMLTAEVLRPAGAARSKGLGCCPTRPLCIDKDIACKALCVQKHCLPRLCWYHGALLAVTNFSPLFHRYDVGTLFRVAVIVAALLQMGVMFSFHLFDGGAMLRGKLGGSFQEGDILFAVSLFQIFDGTLLNAAAALPCTKARSLPRSR